MKTNGTLSTEVVGFGPTSVPAWVIGNFAIHYALDLATDVYFENIDCDARNGTRRVESKRICEVKEILVVSHIHSGLRVYGPKFKTNLPKYRAWIKELKAFIVAIEPLADWSTKELNIKPEIEGKILELRAALPQGKIPHDPTSLSLLIKG